MELEIKMDQILGGFWRFYPINLMGCFGYVPRYLNSADMFFPSKRACVFVWVRHVRNTSRTAINSLDSSAPSTSSHSFSTLLLQVTTHTAHSTDQQTTYDSTTSTSITFYCNFNIEVLKCTGQQRLQDIVAERRLRMAGHIIRMPPGRPANRAMSWTPRGSGKKRGRPTKTWRSTFKEDLVDRGVDWNSVWAVATDRHRWWTLAAHCPDKDHRI